MLLSAHGKGRNTVPIKETNLIKKRGVLIAKKNYSFSENLIKKVQNNFFFYFDISLIIHNNVSFVSRGYRPRGDNSSFKILQFTGQLYNY